MTLASRQEKGRNIAQTGWTDGISFVYNKL